MDCKHKEHLAREYEAATNNFAAAVTELQHKTGISQKAEYERLQRLSDEARVKSEQARLALEQHIAEHGC